jgi:hypothetical protein
MARSQTAIDWRLAMRPMDVDHARCEALFVSALQQSDLVTADAIAAAISRSMQLFGADGCASRVAQEFGDHPEAACERMRWARQLLDEPPAAAAV